MIRARRSVRIAKNFYEIDSWSKNELVAGIDEVGRGCLCGPLVTASVILHPGKKSNKLKDSKLLDQDELLDGYKWIVKNSWYSTAIVTHRLIDEINIYQATLRAMKRSLMQLIAVAPAPKLVLVDAMPLKIDNIAVIHFPFGEQYSSSIAAASIVAKVTRDKIMQRLDHIIPGYYMGQHKGYSTKLHGQTLELNGESFIHRKSYLKKFEFLNESNELNESHYEQQEVLW